MHIISKKALRDFWEKHPNSKTSLQSWYSITKNAEWENLADVRADFPHADLAGICTVFNIAGNNYRLITKIYYEDKVVLIRFVLTHAEYDKKPYKDDCEC
ncbi:MAG: type II toxin-antitoxin system HigB family toxin [Pyrinomonadaceae bacterium]|nr:type II toxin-antitoxin system HigB family toxin [Pyrinomonadaceae bacterium]